MGTSSALGMMSVGENQSRVRPIDLAFDKCLQSRLPRVQPRSLLPPTPHGQALGSEPHTTES